MKLTIAGPNLRNSEHTFHVHAAGCADLKGRQYRGIEPPWSAEFDTEADVIRDVYSDIMRENGEDPDDPATVATYTNEFRFFPCVDRLTQPAPAAKMGAPHQPPDPVVDGQKEGTMPKATSTTEPTPCGCGCGAVVNRRFLPGHDARLKGQLIRAFRGDNAADRKAAVARALELGWSSYLTEAKPRAPRPPKAVKADSNGQAEPKAGFHPVKVKIGRWTYDAVILSEDVNEVTVRYTKGAGGSQPTVKTVKRSALVND